MTDLVRVCFSGSLLPLRVAEPSTAEPGARVEREAEQGVRLPREAFSDVGATVIVSPVLRGRR